MNTTRTAPATPLRGYSTLNQGWTMTMQFGEPIRFENQRFGVLEIGMHPGGKFDQWLFHENGGGGVMTVGYARKADGLYVMMLVANRFNMAGDEDDIEVPGGFFDGREAALTGAARETIEETGVNPDLTPLTGRNFVGNRAFWVVDGEHEGTRVFGFELTDDQVTLIEADPRLRLMRWQDAVHTTRDALSGMAIARAIAELL